MSTINLTDILDIRDIATLVREIADTDEPLRDGDDVDTIDTARTLADNLGRRGLTDPREIADALESYGNGEDPTLIREDHFTDYAQELAEEIGAVQSDAAWPVRHIDWEAAADELRQDYDELTIEGVGYLIRSC